MAVFALGFVGWFWCSELMPGYVFLRSFDSAQDGGNGWRPKTLTMFVGPAFRMTEIFYVSRPDQ